MKVNAASRPTPSVSPATSIERITPPPRGMRAAATKSVDAVALPSGPTTNVRTSVEIFSEVDEAICAVTATVLDTETESFASMGNPIMQTATIVKPSEIVAVKPRRKRCGTMPLIPFLRGWMMATNDESLMLTADTLNALRRYLAFIDTRAESLARRDAEPADRARALDDLKGATSAARTLLAGKPAGIVLVVDDEPAIHQLARRILEPEGYMVVAVSDAPSALVTLGSLAADVVLVDVHMPGPTGLWLATRIRESYPTTAVVFATADETLAPTETFRKGIVGYVLKPFRHDLLLQCVVEGVRWASAQRGTDPQS